jgi:hydrogenase nickel incorporation protein HypA/HybF
MHEMSLAEGIVQLVEETAATQGFSKVRAVFVEIGRLSSVEPEALAFCFEAVTRGSLVEGARLEIVDVPGSGLCLACGKGVPVAALYEPCPLCGDYQVRITGGTEMRVKELEVD